MAKKLTGLMGLTAGAMMIAAGTAFALDSSVEAMEMSGEHQFYVWCTGADDYQDTHSGSDWKDAQLALYNELASSGHTNCWPVWQGLVN